MSQPQTVQCPYNPRHVMRHKTLVLHLMKCPDKSPDFKTCSYNSLHVIHESKIKDHESECPDAIKANAVLYTTPDVEPVKRPVFDSVSPPPTVVDDEIWNGPEASGFENKPQIQKLNLMKPTPGLTKMERKKLRADMHKKHIGVDLSYNKNLSINERQEAKDNSDKKAKETP